MTRPPCATNPCWTLTGSDPLINTVTVTVTGHTFIPCLRALFGLAFGDINGDITYGDISATMRSPIMKPKQSGSTVVEFALVGFVLFLTFFLGLTDFARMLYTWARANEASRNGSTVQRLICDDAATRPRFWPDKRRPPQIGNSTCGVESSQAANEPTCGGVTVTITSLNYQWISPIAGGASLAAIPMPTFSTYLPREIMKQDPLWRQRSPVPRL